MHKNSNHIIFDLDGTIINSKMEIFKTYRLVFEQCKPDTSLDISHLNFGATLNEVLKHVYDGQTEKIEEAKLLFAAIYDHSEYQETNLYEGVLETLAYLKLKKNELYIATNKRYVPTLRILQLKRLIGYFSGIMANEMTPNVTLTKSEMISQLKTKYSFLNGFMVGDTTFDIQAGKDQNLKTIAVTYGYENSNIFATQNPNYIIDSFKEIIKIIQNS